MNSCAVILIPTGWHAAKGGTLDALLDDPGFLAAVSPQSLLRFRTATSSSKGQQAMDVYSTVSHSLLAARGALGRGSYLQMAARQMGYEELANRFTAEGLIGGWEVRATNHAVYTPHIVVDDLAGPGDLVKLLEPLEWEGGMALLWLCSNGQTIIEDIETATPFASFRVPTRGPIRGACLAQRGGKRLLVGCAGDSRVFVWDLDQQQMEREHTVLHPPLPGSSSLQLDYSQFEEVEMLALASQYLDESHGIQVRDLASGELLLEKDIGYWLAVDELRFLELSTGPALAAVGDEGDIKIWDLSTREVRRVILGDLASGTKVNCLKILQKRPKTLGVVSGGKGLLSTVDFENNSIKQITRQGAERASNNAAASGVSTPTTDFPDETKLLVDVAIRNRSHVGALFYETTGVVRFIDLQNGSEAFAPLNTPFDKYADEFTFYSNKGRMFFAGANNGVIRVWELKLPSADRFQRFGHCALKELAVLPQCDRLYLIGIDDSDCVLTLDPNSGLVERKSEKVESEVYGMAVRHFKGEGLLLTASEDGKGRLWQLPELRCIRTLYTAPKGRVVSAAFAELNGNVVAVFGLEIARLAVCDVQTGTLLYPEVLMDGRGPIWELAVTAVGAGAHAYCLRQGCPTVIDLATGNKIEMGDSSIGQLVGDVTWKKKHSIVCWDKNGQELLLWDPLNKDVMDSFPARVTLPKVRVAAANICDTQVFLHTERAIVYLRAEYGEMQIDLGTDVMAVAHVTGSRFAFATLGGLSLVDIHPERFSNRYQ